MHCGLTTGGMAPSHSVDMDGVGAADPSDSGDIDDVGSELPSHSGDIDVGVEDPSSSGDTDVGSEVLPSHSHRGSAVASHAVGVALIVQSKTPTRIKRISILHIDVACTYEIDRNYWYSNCVSFALLITINL